MRDFFKIIYMHVFHSILTSQTLSYGCFLLFLDDHDNEHNSFFFPLPLRIQLHQKGLFVLEFFLGNSFISYSVMCSPLSSGISLILGL